MALVVASQRNGRHSLSVITMESVAGARLVDSSRIACVRSAPDALWPTREFTMH